MNKNLNIFLKLTVIILLPMLVVNVKAQSTFSLRSDGVILKNGQPFFPFGFYHVSWGSSSADMIKHLNILADAGFNVMHASQTPSNNYGAFLDEANKRNIFVITEFGDDRLKVVNQYKSKPAVLGWNIADDIDNGHTTREQTIERHKQLKAADPNHLTYVSGYKRTTQPSPNIGNYVDIPDTVGMQSYPISMDILGAVYVTMANAVDAAKPYNRPIIGNVQSFKWYHSGARAPTAKEARNMTYQALIAGVKGIIYYTFYDSSNYLPNYVDAWDEFKALVPEIKQLSPVFLNGKLSRVNTGAQGVYASYWEHQNKIYVIAVNTLSNQSKNVAIKLPADAATQATSMFANRPTGLVVNNGNLTGTIHPEDVHIYVLETSSGTPPPTPPPTPTPGQLSHTIQLQKNWNMISLPIEPSDTDIADVLRPIDGMYTAVYSWNETEYEAYIPVGGTSNTLTKLIAGRGYWVFMKDAGSLQVKGKVAAKSVSLKANWNMVGYNSLAPMGATAALASTEGRVTVVYAYDPDSNQYEAVTTLQPGRGYWMLATSDIVWTLP
jgi:hypothetical protein